MTGAPFVKEIAKHIMESLGPLIKGQDAGSSSLEYFSACGEIIDELLFVQNLEQSLVKAIEKFLPPETVEVE